MSQERTLAARQTTAAEQPLLAVTYVRRKQGITLSSGEGSGSYGYPLMLRLKACCGGLSVVTDFQQRSSNPVCRPFACARPSVRSGSTSLNMTGAVS